MGKTIGIFVGSLRKKAYTRMIGSLLVSLFPSEYDAKIIEIGQLEMYDQDLDDENRPTQAWIDFRKEIADLDGVIFITPEYNRSVPAVLKNAIDVGSRPYGKNLWDGKPGAVVSSSIGAISGFGAHHHLRQILVFVNVLTLAQPEVYLADVGSLFDEDGNITNEGTKNFLQSFVNTYIEWFEKNKA